MRFKANKDEIMLLEKTINAIAEMYFWAISKKDYEQMIFDAENELSDYERFVIRVRHAFDKLSQTEKEFINNDFFYQEYPDWWKGKYSKATYFKIHKRSMLSFKEAFEHE